MKKLTGLLFALLLLPVRTAPAADLMVLTENLPPLNYMENDTLVGPSVEIVAEIITRVGSNATIEVYPWARAYQLALEKENVVLFGMTHTEERHDKFKWIGPLATKRDILVARRDSGITLHTLEDAKKVNRIGTLRDDTRERLLKRHGFENLEPVSDERLNAQKLAMGRIDIWAYKIPGLRTVCDLANVDHRQFAEVYHLRTIDVSIAFSKKTSDAIVKRWKAAFDEMLADGTILKIRQKWNDRLPDNPFPEFSAELSPN